jgi:O-antigen ligase
MIELSQERTRQYLNYLIIALAFSFPISKAAVNLLEVLMILLWLYEGNWKHKFEQLRSNTFILAFGLFIFYIFISVFWASSLSYWFEYVLKYHHYLLLPVIYTSLEKKYVRYVLYAFIASMFISEILSYGIYFGLFTIGRGTPSFPTPFMHHITYSVVLTFTSTILLVSAMSEKRLKMRLFDAFFFITVVTNLFINGGRTGQVVFIVLIFTVFMMYIKNKLKAFIIAVVIIVTTFSLAYNFSHNFAARIHQFEKGIEKVFTKQDYTDQGGMRAAMWIIGAHTFVDNPLIGTGIGNEMRDANACASKLHMKTKDMNGFADYHNIFINIAAQLGIIGLTLLLNMLYRLYRLEFKTKEYAILNRAFLISFILFSCTHNTLHIMIPMLYFVLFAGFFVAVSRIEKDITYE